MAKIPDGAVNETEDVPLHEAARMANELIDSGAVVFMKFTCEKCGQRLTMDVPNTFYYTGSCDQCGHVTKIKYCGLIAVKKLGEVLFG